MAGGALAARPPSSTLLDPPVPCMPYQTHTASLLDRRSTCAAADGGHVCTGQQRRRPFGRGVSADTARTVRCTICDALAPSYRGR
jgi:hypothetical protein